MRIPAHALPAALILALTFGITGCATTYNYTQQKDSAFVRGTDGDLFAIFQGPSVDLYLIDGLPVGMHWNANSGRFVSPGNHEIFLMCFEPGFEEAEEGPVDVKFAANHTYRFTISSGCAITLWDETSGVENLSVGNWNFNNYESTYEISDDEPIAQVDFGGTKHARPPLDRGETPPRPGEHPAHPGGAPSHPGRPPSIPHNPRPKSGGGHSSGARSGGGGKKR